ncbi:MAG TPA: ankyrin repeat domain-containing protein, partial [Candidatus Babeliaceae bacterium]|nr:ankyrin repeat domain-containing protein [Candidatus Babeliaceae bacterium]
YGAKPDLKSLGAALWLNNQAIIQPFIDYGLDLNAFSKLQESPLFNSIAEDKKNIAKLLLKSGASLQKVLSGVKQESLNANFNAIQATTCLKFQQKCEEFFPPLTLAALRGDLKTFKKAWKNAHLSIIHSIGDILKNLFINSFLKKQAKPKTIKKRMSLLHWAACQGNFDIVRFLLRKREVDLNAYAKSGDTPADLAVRNGHDTSAQAILAAGGKLNTQRWLHAAVWRQDVQAIQKLIAQNPELVNEQDNNGDTPMHIAGTQPHTPVLNLLLNKFTNLNIRNNKKNTPIQIIFTNVCPGNLSCIAVGLLADALAVLSKSQEVTTKIFGEIPEIRYCLASALVYSFEKDIFLPQKRNLSIAQTLRALYMAAKNPT